VLDAGSLPHTQGRHRLSSITAAAATATATATAAAVTTITAATATAAASNVAGAIAIRCVAFARHAVQVINEAAGNAQLGVECKQAGQPVRRFRIDPLA
jgi:hypothetical protein